MKTVREQGVANCQQSQQRQSPASHMLRTTMYLENEYAPVVERIADGDEVMNDGTTRLNVPEGTRYFLVACESTHFSGYYYVVVFSPAYKRLICTADRTNERVAKRAIEKVQEFIAQKKVEVA